jgi:hypothetical protein
LSRNWNEDTERFVSVGNGTIKCSCGHSVLTAKPKTVCTWCGNYVYRDKRLEFEERLKRSLKKED